MSNINKELYNKIKEYMYAYNLEDLRILSKQYMHSIILPKYSNNKDTSPYCIISMDFNNLNSLNTKKGYEIGDLVMHNLLDLILKSSFLPKNSKCIRIGGDEFLLILENTSIDNANIFIDKIHKIEKDNQNQLYDISVTAYAVSSENFNNIEEMVNFAEEKISNKKQNLTIGNSLDNFNNIEILDKKLSQTFSVLFKSLRLYEDVLDISDLKAIYNSSISAISRLLEENNLKYNPDEHNNEKPFKSNLDINLANELDFILDTTSYPEELDKTDINSYISVLRQLVLEPNTNHFSKTYLNKFLLKEEGLSLKAKYVSLAFIKLHNTLYSYNATNNDIRNTIDGLYSYCKSVNTDGKSFNDSTFSSEKKMFFIDLSGGDFLILCEPSLDIDALDFNNYIDNFNKHSSNLLKLTCSNNSSIITQYNTQDVLESLSKECKKNKNTYKKELIHSDSFTDILYILLKDSINYYDTHFPQPDSISSKSKFIKIASNSILDSLYEFNKEQLENIRLNSKEKEID